MHLCSFCTSCSPSRSLLSCFYEALPQATPMERNNVSFISIFISRTSQNSKIQWMNECRGITFYARRNTKDCRSCKKMTSLTLEYNVTYWALGGAQELSRWQDACSGKKWHLVLECTNLTGQSSCRISSHSSLTDKDLCLHSLSC